MICETRPRTDHATSAEADNPLLVIVSEPGPVSLLRALNLLSVSGFSPRSLALEHTESDDQAVARIWLAEDVDRKRLSSVADKIAQLPSVWRVEASEGLAGVE
ncbi:hypothetical protein [Henriciella aquimarina]|uniref:hypothetical protein n=1 Tax=Henriciella aquimarina TaxID=545261 RepID=UPI0009FBDA16|nr:hypothetical protein [Henriciella aquimarina]